MTESNTPPHLRIVKPNVHPMRCSLEWNDRLTQLFAQVEVLKYIAEQLTEDSVPDGIKSRISDAINQLSFSMLNIQLDLNIAQSDGNG